MGTVGLGFEQKTRESWKVWCLLTDSETLGMPSLIPGMAVPTCSLISLCSPSP